MGPQGMEEMAEQLKGLFSQLGQGKRKTRKLRIADALRQLVDEEAAKLVNEEEIRAQALSHAEQSGIVFIDEIHRTPRVVEEYLYSAMEDFKLGIPIGEGMNARTVYMTLNRFTLIGATTRSGM